MRRLLLTCLFHCALCTASQTSAAVEIEKQGIANFPQGQPYTAYTVKDALGRNVSLFLTDDTARDNRPLVLVVQGSGCDSNFCCKTAAWAVVGMRLRAAPQVAVRRFCWSKSPAWKPLTRAQTQAAPSIAAMSFGVSPQGGVPVGCLAATGTQRADASELRGNPHTSSRVLVG
jgi:hypothetical protein